MICAPDGGVLDDLIVYRLADAEFLVVANAANTGVVVAALRERARAFPAEVDDLTDDYALIAIQGPHAGRILQPSPISGWMRCATYTGQRAEVAGRKVLLARTGYTGEDGFELFTSPGDAEPSGWRSPGRGKQTGWCPPGSPPAIRSGSRPACRCTGTS
jgi:aminomethyltransferase